MPHNADGLSVSDWSVAGDCLMFGENESEYPQVIRLSAVEAVTLEDGDVVLVSTDRSEYRQRVHNGAGLIARIAQVLKDRT